ncbi:hypothetical protein BH10PSE10_BH10PSE10_06560 [soil metagenome]
MKKVTLFAAAAAVTALIASPVLAQDTVQPRAGVHAKTYKSKHHMKYSARMQHRDAGYMRTTDRWNDRDDWNNRGWDNRNSGFWPADVVGGAVGTAGAIATGAVNTAGAIATAPFGGPYRNDYAYRDTYAYGGPRYAEGYNYDGVAIPYSASYAARNGFLCQPGTVTRPKNGNGAPVICQ